MSSNYREAQTSIQNTKKATKQIMCRLQMTKANRTWVQGTGDETPDTAETWIKGRSKDKDLNILTETEVC